MAVTQEVRNKVVVRKLPPGISVEEVQAAINVVCEGKYDWFTFVPGKVRCAENGNQHGAAHDMFIGPEYAAYLV